MEHARVGCSFIISSLSGLVRSPLPVPIEVFDSLKIATSGGSRHIIRFKYPLVAPSRDAARLYRRGYREIEIGDTIDTFLPHTLQRALARPYLDSQLGNRPKQAVTTQFTREAVRRELNSHVR